MSVSQYLHNAMKMMRDWSKDRIFEKQFYEQPKVDDNSWKFAYNFLNPTTNIEYLQREYNITEYFLSKYTEYNSFLKTNLLRYFFYF